MSIYASIILYNPDIELLQKNISAVKNQVDGIIIIDNGAGEKSTVFEVLEAKAALSSSEFIIVKNKKNEGIAKALNQAVCYCIKNSIEWLLTLDQDSVVPDNMINIYKKYISLPYVGQLTCKFYNPNNEDYSLVNISESKPWTELQKCITSGCMMNVKACEKVGMFDDRLFIDDVDYEYSLRMRKKGFKIYGISQVNMEHHLGNAVEKKFVLFKYIDYQYTPQRTYYQARNGMYIIRFYPEARAEFVKILVHAVATAFLGRRYNAVKMFFVGLRDGLKLEVRKFE